MTYPANSQIASLLMAIALGITGCGSTDSANSSETNNATSTSNPKQEIEFVGTVTGYARPDISADPITSVTVDEKRYELDLIWPYSVSCVDGELAESKAFSSAEDELRKILPIGQKVWVKRTTYENGEWIGDRNLVAIHILADGETAPNPSPPAESVNEKLVETGYWVPFGLGVDFDRFSPISTWGKYDSEYLSATQEMYLPLLSEAANPLRLAAVGPHAECITSALNYQIDNFNQQLSFFRNNEEENRLWWIQKLKSNGCRDGDGDGVCYER
jgi:hypothetical protein